MLLISSSQSGKTTWITKLIQNFSEINKTPLKSILYFHASNNPEIFVELLQKLSTSHHRDKNIPHMSFINITEQETAIQKNRKRTTNIEIQQRKRSDPIKRKPTILGNIEQPHVPPDRQSIKHLALERCHHEGMNIIFVKISCTHPKN